MASKINLYKDIDLRLIPHPLSGDVQTLNNTEAVRQSIKNILMMQKWDVPFRSDHGAVRSMLFEIPDPVHVADMKIRLDWMIRSMEPRIKLRSIDVNLSDDESAYHVTVHYTIRSLYKDDTIDYFFQRVR